MRVLSLCDGISCGYLALKKLGIEFEYHAVEIDKYPREISGHNIKDIFRFENDVTKITREMVKKHGPYDLVTFGSPCQSVSVSGKGEGLKGESGLLIDCIKILRWCQEDNPDLKYIIENVKMKKGFLEQFDALIGYKGTLINSSLLSAQNRERYYWTNLKDKISQPEDAGILLKDILEENPKDYDVVKLSPSTAERFKRYGLLPCNEFKKSRACSARGYEKNGRQENYLCIKYSSSSRGNGVVEDRLTENPEKSGTATATMQNSRSMTIVNENEEWRKLTVREYARLQTIPEEFSFSNVSKTQAYKGIGNGWTISVIVHILQNLLQSEKENDTQL